MSRELWSIVLCFCLALLAACEGEDEGEGEGCYLVLSDSEPEPAQWLMVTNISSLQTVLLTGQPGSPCHLSLLAVGGGGDGFEYGGGGSGYLATSSQVSDNHHAANTISSLPGVRLFLLERPS